ncbi:MAG: PIG-L family deacetylase [Crocinitomicaceae bacterium]
MKNSLLFSFALFSVFLHAQKPKQLSSSEIFAGIQKLNVQGKILYLAAHPDDENTRFIAYCANDKKLTTAYMSLTRGDGGQDLIGPELGEELGLIRTQELLMARNIDGGRQFFSRANDFGFSKNPTETFAIWNKELVLGDLVFVIRSFQPDIIVCRFPADGRGGHGHHTASAILGEEAFALAANKDAYPEQFDLGVKPWQATRIVTNTGKWWNDKISANDPHVVAENIGAYETLLGTSCTEIAALSRSQHKSQGFGSTGARGEQLEYFEHVAGLEAEKSLFDGIDMSWNRVKNGKKITTTLDKIILAYDILHPEKSIPALLGLRNQLETLEAEKRVEDKIQEVNFLILQCAGMYAEAKSNTPMASAGDSLILDLEVIARQSSEFKLVNIESTDLGWKWRPNSLLKKNLIFEKKEMVKLVENLPTTQQYWLKEKGTLGTYHLENQALVLHPDNGANSELTLTFEVFGQKVPMKIPIVFKENDPVKGEVYVPFNIVPAVSIRFEKENLLVKDFAAQSIKVSFKSYTDKFEGAFLYKLPMGWEIENAPETISLVSKGEEKTVTFSFVPTKTAVSGPFTLEILDKNKVDVLYSKSVKFIEYDHIPTQLYMQDAQVQLNVIDIKKAGNFVGYIAGAGDEVASALSLVGYQVDNLKEDNLANLAKYDAIVLGIRALNTNERIGTIMPQLMEYVKNGGNLILQYNTSNQLKTDNFSPFPLKLGRDRVTDENAMATFLAPEHPVLNVPNKITAADFENWVQERGLNFPSEWSKEFTPILAFNDPGEKSLEGSLLIAKYGEGNYMYTSLSFFRELPAGVPGAYRLLVNLISLGNE